MEPTLHSGQVLRLNHSLPGQIPRGAIVLVTRFPFPPYLKRVVGLPHEKVSFELGEVFINGKMLRERYLPDSETTFSWKYDQLTTQEGQYVVLGDNRLTSLDSRDYGVVSRDRIVATINLPFVSPELLDHPQYRLTNITLATFSKVAPRAVGGLPRGSHEPL